MRGVLAGQDVLRGRPISATGMLCPSSSESFFDFLGPLKAFDVGVQDDATDDLLHAVDPVGDWAVIRTSRENVKSLRLQKASPLKSRTTSGTVERVQILRGTRSA